MAFVDIGFFDILNIDLKENISTLYYTIFCGKAMVELLKFLKLKNFFAALFQKLGLFKQVTQNQINPEKTNPELKLLTKRSVPSEQEKILKGKFLKKFLKLTIKPQKPLKDK